MAAYGVVVNAPFIAVQRYNRQRAQRILARRADPTGRDGASAERQVERLRAGSGPDGALEGVGGGGGRARARTRGRSMP